MEKKFEFDDVDDEELDFVQPHESISVRLNILESLKTFEVLEKIKAEINKWYWDADKQKIANDPCVVDAMTDLFIRTINKYQEKEANNDDIIDQIKKEFIDRYPKNHMGDLYLNGRNCYFSLNQVLNILDKYKKEN